MQTDTPQTSPYNQAVQSGQYERPTGLRGKYDNVRNFWEDEITRHFLRPHLEQLIARAGNGKSRLRVLDLGCGGGDGYETIMAMRAANSGLSAPDVAVLPAENLARYVGVDINADLLKQARARYSDRPEVSFVQGDLGEGLPLEGDDAAFDLYFSSFGTFSHFHDAPSERLMADIVRKAPHGALLVCDWLGRYSFEWQQLWDRDVDHERWMDYRISYIYPPEVRAKVKIDTLKLRLWSRTEVERLVQATEKRTGARLEPLEVFDRSLLVGRHMDTAEYNPHAPPLREAVNRLYEPGLRSDLTALLYEPHAREGFAQESERQQALGKAWNELVRHTLALCQQLDDDRLSDNGLAAPAFLPARVRQLFDTMTDIVRASRVVAYGDVRADFIEPQLAGSLQALERLYQQGQGSGHGLVGVFAIKKN